MLHAINPSLEKEVEKAQCLYLQERAVPSFYAF
jgi:hypothetical protein